MRIPDHFIRVVPLPPAVRGVTVPNDDGTFSVYINSIYDTASQRSTLEHELEHLARDHFYSQAPVAVQEAEAGRKPQPLPATVHAAVPGKKQIRLYRDLRALERYLRSVSALEKPIEELGEKR